MTGSYAPFHADKKPLHGMGFMLELPIRWIRAEHHVVPAPTGQANKEGFVAVKLRLKRFGRRHRSFYRVNAMDSRAPRDGRVIEELGWYDPQAKDTQNQISLKRERIEHWLKVGAQPSETVRRLLRRQGIL